MKEVDRVLKYFEEADPAEARVILHIVTKKLEGREPTATVVRHKRVKRTMSPEARQRIADAQKERWAKVEEKQSKRGRKGNSLPAEIPDAPALVGD